MFKNIKNLVYVNIQNFIGRVYIELEFGNCLISQIIPSIVDIVVCVTIIYNRQYELYLFSALKFDYAYILIRTSFQLPHYASPTSGEA